MNESLKMQIVLMKLQIEQCIYFAKFCYVKKYHKDCKRWIELGNSSIKFLEYYMNQKEDYQPFKFYDDISFDIDKDTGTKILQKYPNT